MSVEAVRLALEAGVRAIDTAAAYENEREVGKAWKASGLKREEVILSSKLANVDLRSGNVRKAVETSLKNLQTNYLDAYYIHSPLASPAQREKAWKDMQAMKKEGVIRACGVCNFGVSKIKMLADGRRKPAPDIVQAEISPFNQVWSMRESCARTMSQAPGARACSCGCGVCSGGRMRNACMCVFVSGWERHRICRRHSGDKQHDMSGLCL